MRVLAVACACMAAFPASFAAAEGFYATGSVGAAFLESSGNTAGPAFNIFGDYDTGWALRGGIGYGFANGVRLEGEIGYRRNDWTRLRIVADGGLGRSLGIPPLNGVTLPTTGDESALSFMANGWYDIPTGTKFTPYVGGGIGLARLSVNSLASSGLTLVDDSDLVFAFQLGAGLSYAITPRLSATIDYRYFGTADPTFRDFEGVAFSSDYHSHTVSAGFRFNF